MMLKSSDNNCRMSIEFFSEINNVFVRNWFFLQNFLFFFFFGKCPFHSKIIRFLFFLAIYSS